MVTKERREKILSIVNNANCRIKTSELASQLNVTSETIRKDLIYLDQRKLLKKFHGGAKPVAEFKERSLELRLKDGAIYKKAIAQEALAHFTDCAVVFIDAGSTTTELASLLVSQSHSALAEKAFITNSFPVANILNGHAKTLFFLGGEVCFTTQSTGGFWAQSEFDSISIDLAFLGTSGFCSRQGPCTMTSPDAIFKSNIIKHSTKKILLADHTKFITNALMQYARWSEIDTLITDSQVTEEQMSHLKNHVHIITAADIDTDNDLADLLI
ncbi:MAG: DeoR/GlpR transcriptional regulator [Lachnospiraceae bacterium]|jgi:DeoR/GlpR family transcriptional regulator of sugar metabolism|nr:DeoR/GlpR transcriptional regulator [Lachnospiraceae bacterium]